MLTLAALNYQEFFVSLQRHKIIQHFFSIFFFLRGSLCLVEGICYMQLLFADI